MVNLKRVPFIVILFLWAGTSVSFAQIPSDEQLQGFCNKKNSVACFKIGKKALSLDKDKKKALKYFLLSCELDHMTACNFAGALTQNKGTNFSPQWKEAKKLFTKACEAGEDAACFNLGALYYREGRASRARKWFKKACDMKNEIACTNLKKLDK